MVKTIDILTLPTPAAIPPSRPEATKIALCPWTRLLPRKAAGSLSAEAYAEECSKRPSNAAAGERKPEA